ncbi:MAG: tetratricopeptide repeat protein, partial [Saprospiraceae bacterium]
MYTNFRAAWLSLAFACAATLLSAQSTFSEDLQRADKQYDLYAYNLALRTYEEVLKVQPNNAHALARTGDCYFQLNRPEDALPWYDKAAKRPEVEPISLLHYGKTLLQTGDYVGARKWFVRYAETDPVVGNHYAALCDYAAQNAGKEGLYAVKNEALNTVAADFSPALYGNKVAYSSSRTDIQRQTQSKTSSDWSGAAYNQLYVTQRNPDGSYLQKPQFLRSDLQNAYNEGPVSFSSDGKRVAFCRNNFIDGTRQIAEKGINMSLYTADVENGTWVNIKAFPFNGSDYATGFPTLSPNGNMMLFASNQPGGFGGWDIYVSNYVSGNWTTPRNVGTPLNTPGNEVTPYYDGKDLYFSSDWHNGLGGLDIFRAELGDESVSNVYQLGPGLNSSYDDYGFVYSSDQKIGYFTSNRPGGRGHEDIWQAIKTRESTLAAETIVPAAASALASPSPTQYSTATPATPTQYNATIAPAQISNASALYVLVTDEYGNVLPSASLDFSACGLGYGSTDLDGKFYFKPLVTTVDCSLHLTKTSYEETAVDLTGFGQRNVIVAM